MHTKGNFYKVNDYSGQNVFRRPFLRKVKRVLKHIKGYNRIGGPTEIRRGHTEFHREKFKESKRVSNSKKPL
jgi:hypothetical protein